MKNFCYTPVKGIDDVIAEKINSTIEGDSWTPYRVATLRGIYDEKRSEKNSYILFGFGYAMAKGVEKAVAQYGIVGALAGGLTAAAGGISAAVFFTAASWFSICIFILYTIIFVLYIIIFFTQSNVERQSTYIPLEFEQDTESLTKL